MTEDEIVGWHHHSMDVLIYICSCLVDKSRLTASLWPPWMQVPLSMGCPKQEFPSPGDFSDPWSEPTSPALQACHLLLNHLGRSYIYTPIHISLFFWILFWQRSLQNIQQSSLCYTVVSYQLSIVYMLECICQFQSPNLPSLPYPFGNHNFHSWSHMLLFSSCQ